MDGRRTKCRRNTAENFNRLSRVHELQTTDRRQTTDGRATDERATACSEHGREFTFANELFRTQPNRAESARNFYQEKSAVVQLDICVSIGI